jgi:acyl-CoA thioester hydrolase
MDAPFTFTRRVLFHETDLAGIMHFSNFFKWMEEAEHALLRSLGLSVHPMRKEGHSETRTGWPRVSAKCDYHAPLMFEELVDVRVAVVELRSKSVRYRMHFHKQDAASTLAASGELTVVSIQADPETRKMRAIAIPDSFRQALEPLVIS